MELYISVASTVLALFSVAVSLVTYSRTVAHNRKKDTLDAYNTLQEQAFDKLNLIMPKEIAEIAKHPSSPDYKKLSGYLARIEHFCVGVNKGIYDRKTVYALAHGYLDGNQILSRILPLIERRNQNSEDFYKNIKFVLGWMREKAGAEK